MAGMIDKAGPAAGAQLKQIEQKLEAELPPELKRDYLAIVVAGMKLMFSDQTHPQMEEYLTLIQGPQDVPKIVAHGIVKAISIIFNASKGKMSIPASPPAAVVLMCHALAYVEQQKQMPVTPDMIAQTTMLLQQGLIALYKVPKEMLVKAIQENAGKKQQPGAATPGATKPTPGAATPTQGDT